MVDVLGAYGAEPPLFHALDEMLPVSGTRHAENGHGDRIRDLAAEGQIVALQRAIPLD